MVESSSSGIWLAPWEGHPNLERTSGQCACGGVESNGLGSDQWRQRWNHSLVGGEQWGVLEDGQGTRGWGVVAQGQPK